MGVYDNFTFYIQVDTGYRSPAMFPVRTLTVGPRAPLATETRRGPPAALRKRPARRQGAPRPSGHAAEPSTPTRLGAPRLPLAQAALLCLAGDIDGRRADGGRPRVAAPHRARAEPRRRPLRCSPPATRRRPMCACGAALDSCSRARVRGTARARRVRARRANRPPPSTRRSRARAPRAPISPPLSCLRRPRGGCQPHIVNVECRAGGFWKNNFVPRWWVLEKKFKSVGP